MLLTHISLYLYFWKHFCLAFFVFHNSYKASEIVGERNVYILGVSYSSGMEYFW